MLTKKPLRVIDQEFKPLGEINKYSSLIIERCFRTIGRMTITIHQDLIDPELVKKRNIIFPHTQYHRAHIIRHIEVGFDEGGRISEDFTIIAQDLKSMLGQRITIPDAGQSHQVFSGTASQVANGLAIKNAVNPTDAKRKIENLLIGDSDIGGNHELQSRLRNVAEELEKITENLGLGWTIDLDIKNKKFVFKPLEGVDRTYDNGINEPLLFSRDLNTLKNLQVTDSELDYKNFAIVAGQGEGIERRIITMSSDDYEGLDLFETFVDARDVKEETDEGNPIPEHRIIERLENRGQEKLNEAQQEFYAEADAKFGFQEERYDFEEKVVIPALNMATVYQGKRNFVVAWQPSEEDMYDVYPKVQKFEIEIPTKFTHINKIELTINGSGTENVSAAFLVNGELFEIVDGSANFGNVEIQNKIRLVVTLTSGDITPVDISFQGVLSGAIVNKYFGLNGYEYEKDFDLGDYATLLDSKLNIRHDAQIIKFTEIYEPNKTELLMTFDKERPTLISKIKSEFKDLQVIAKE